MLQREFKRYCFPSDFRKAILLLRKEANRVDTFLSPVAVCLAFASQISGVTIFLKQYISYKKPV